MPYIEGPAGFDFTSNGARVIVAGEGSSNVALYDIAPWACIGTVDLMPGCQPWEVVVDDSRQVAYVSQSNFRLNKKGPVRPSKLACVRLDPFELLWEVESGVGTNGVAFAPSLNRLFAANTRGNCVSVIDVSTRKLCAEIETGDGPFSVALSPDETRVAVTNQLSGTVGFIDAVNLELETEVWVSPEPGMLEYILENSDYPAGPAYIEFATEVKTNQGLNVEPAFVASIAWHPTDGRVYCANFDQGILIGIDADSRKVMNVASVVQTPYSIAVSKNGELGVVTDDQLRRLSVFTEGMTHVSRDVEYEVDGPFELLSDLSFCSFDPANEFLWIADSRNHLMNRVAVEDLARTATTT